MARFGRRKIKTFFEDDNIGLQLSMDFVNPYGKGSETRYSIGVLSAVILNLPKEERFRKENMLVLGIIPGPKEPHLHINGFLEPLVRDLVVLSSGVVVETSADTSIVFKARLLGVTGDLPAVRKLLASVSFRTKHGCSKCWGEIESSNVGALRTHAEVHQAASHYRDNVASKVDDLDHAREFLARWCVLYQLDYFDHIRGHVVDPMHNLFLGVVLTHITRLMTEVLAEEDKKVLDARLEAMSQGGLSSSKFLGRLPTNLTTYYRSMRAEQLLNFALHFSMVALRGLISGEHYDCWAELVSACRLFCSPTMDQSTADAAHKAYVKYLAAFSSIFGKEALVPNHHMALHLQDVLLDFGPVFSFWTFPFERLNGCLQDFPTNGINIEAQVLRRCVLGFITCRTLVNSVFTQALRISTVFLDPMEAITLKRRAPAFRPRNTACPLPGSFVSGTENLDGEFLGVEKFTMLSTALFESLQHFLSEVPVTNGIPLFTRFRLGSVVISTTGYAKCSPTLLSWTVVTRGTKNVVKFGTVAYFASVTVNKAVYRLALLNVFKASTRSNFPYPLLAVSKEQTWIPIARLERVWALTPLSSSEESSFAVPLLVI